MYSDPSAVRSPSGSTTFTRLTRATAALALGLAVATCGSDAPTAGASLLFFAAQPGNAAAGATLGSIRVEARDASGNVVRSFTGAVTLTITTGSGTAGATLSGTVTVSAVDGTATFSNLSIDKAGLGYTLTATTTSLTPASSTPFDISPGPLSALAFAVQPTQFTAGGTINPAVQVTARDALGNAITSFNGNVTMVIGSNPAGGTLSGTTAVAAIGGVATFSNLSIDKSGSGYTLTASTTGPPAVGVTSASFNVLAGPASQLVFTTLPGSAIAGQALSPAVVVTARDALGNTATGFTANVTMAFGLNPGGATLGGTTTVAAVSGVATFSNLTVNRTGSGYTLVAAAGALSTPASPPFDVAPGAASQVAFVQQPTTTTAGATITPAITVEAQDAVGNVVPSFTGAITLSIGTNPGAGTLSGTTSVGASSGVASFSSLSIDKSGAGYTLVAAATGLSSGTSASFDIAAGFATQIEFAVQPSNAVAGSAISPAVVVTARDALGNLASAFTGNVTITIGANPAGGTLSGTTTVAAASGTATFGNLAIDRAGVSYTLTAAAAGLGNVTSGPFTITPGAASRLAFTVQPSTAVAGAPIAPAVVVTALDALGNTVTGYVGDVTIAIETNPGSGILSGTTTLAVTSGAASFSDLSINRSGVGYALSATSGSLTPATSAAFDITAGTASELVFTVQPSATTAGAAIAPAIEVTARDAAGNTATSFTGDVTIALGANPGGGTLSGTATVGAVNGVALFSTLSVDRRGAGYTLTASASGLTGATSASFDVAPGTAASLVFSAEPGTTTAGQPITPTVEVTARDAFGNVATSFAGDVTLAIGTNPAGGTLSGTVTRSAVAGVALFDDLSINRSGVGYTLTASALNVTDGTSGAFDVTPGPPSQLAFTVVPSTVPAGQPMTPAVQVAAQDALGNATPAFAGDINIAMGANPSGGVLSGTLTMAVVNGVASFDDLVIDKSGAGYTLLASTASLTGAESQPFDVVGGAAVALVFTVQPSDAAAGAAIAPAVEVTARDAFGNVATGFGGDVSLAVATNPGGGSLAGTTTLAAVSGVAMFSDVSIDKSGVGYTLAASAAGVAATTSVTFNITAGAATRLVFTVAPTDAIAGTPLSPAVEVSAQDGFGNTDPSFSGDVTVAIATNPGGGALSGTTTAPTVNGVATFGDLSIERSGSGYTLTASTAGLTAGTSAPFDITAGTATRLVFAVEPITTPAGQAITPAVEVAAQDVFGNTAASFTGDVSVSIGANPVGGTLSGTATVAAASGVATFATLSIDKVGSGYTLAATASGLTGAASAAFDIEPGPAAQLVFSVQPSTATAGVAITPALEVTVLDAVGNRATGFVDNITLTIATNPAGGTLAGTTSVAAVAGMATFSDVRLDKAGAGYVLSADATGLPGTLSGSFNVVAGAATEILFAVSPATTTAGAVISPPVKVTARDAFGNLATSFASNVSVSIAANPGGGVLAGTTTQAAVNGVATFNNLRIDAVGNGYTLSALSSGLPTATSEAFNIVPSTAVSLSFETQPFSTVAGNPIPEFRVQALDASGQRASSFTGNVTVVIGTNPANGTLSGTTTVAAVAGVATFSGLSIDKVGPGYRLRATSGALGAATSAEFRIDPGPATSLAFSLQPSTTTVGAVISPAIAVTAFDALGNRADGFTGSVTLTFGSNPGGGALSGTTTVTATGGIARFSDIAINAAGTGYTLMANSGTLTAATSAPFNITAAQPHRLAFTVQPTTTSAGSMISPPVQVTLRDSTGATRTEFTGAVTVALLPGMGPLAATLSGTTTQFAINGVATFSDLSIGIRGSYKLTATAAGVSGATSNDFTINAGPPTAVVFADRPATAIAGQPMNLIEVIVRDALGNRVTGATNSVTVALGNNPGESTLSGTTTVAAVDGIAAFTTLSLDRAASGYTLIASSPSLASGTSETFNVVGGAATQLQFAVQPSNATRGTSISPAMRVRALDTFGNPAANFSGPVTLAIATNPSGGVLFGPTTANAAFGEAVFTGLSIDRVGAGYTLSATSPGLTGTTSVPFNITAGTGDKLVFSVEPSTTTAGAPITPAVQVTVLDAQGVTKTSFVGNVTLTLSTNPVGGTLSGTTTVPVSAGVASFSDLRVDKASAGYRLLASATGVTGATSTTFAIIPGTATQLAFTVQPITTTAGLAIAPAVQVTARDNQGNTATSFTGDVTIAIGSNPAGGTLSGTSVVAATAGVAAFSNLSIDKAGTGYTLGASATGLAGSGSAAFSITASIASASRSSVTASHATITACSSGCTVGTTASTITVTARDAFDNPISGATVTIAATGTGNTFSPSATGSTNASGVYTATLTSTAAEPKTISATINAVPVTQTGAVTVNPAAPTQLVFTTQPSDANAGATLADVVVAAQDDFGNTVASFSTDVSIAIENNPGPGVLTGTSPVTPSNGVATFSDLSINTAGLGYTLRATANALTVVSDAFNIN